MEPIATIISQIECRWLEVAKSSIVGAEKDQQLSEIYAAGFWLFYVDYTAFYPPYLCINTENLYESNKGAKYDDRWSPPEWKLGLHDATDAMSTDYDPLMEALEGQPASVWDDAIEAHYQAIARVCRALTTEIRADQNPSFSDSFIAAILEERESETEFDRLLCLSVDPSIFRQLSLSGRTNTTL